MFVKAQTFGQIHSHNLVDTFFYFTNYDYYLNKNNVDTSLLFLKIDSKIADVEKLSGKFYSGKCYYAKFNIDIKAKNISASLFDENKKLLKTEVYKFKDTVSKRSDTYFFNVSGIQKKLVWKVITIE